jgi:excinuclease ABC subunit C
MDLNLKMLPKKPGVYIMRGQGGVMLYIGKAVDIRSRVSQYLQEGGHDNRWQIPSLVPLIRKIDFVVAASERDALILEDKLIKQYQPFFNAMLRDDKTYPHIRLNMREDYPRITTVRRPDKKDGALYFGPYPHAAVIKNMLAMLWKNKYLPLRPCKWSFSRAKPLSQKRINGCIYYHLEQCPAPCAGRISYAGYRELANRAKMFLEGDYKNFADDVHVAMRAASRKLDYEAAARLRDFLAAIEHMKERVVISEYKGEKLERKIAVSEKLKRLSELLGSPAIIRHIEAFDNSHLYGKHPVGAMVCFTDGDKYKAHYRRFKIRSAAPAKGADDFAMIKEIVARRLAQVAQLPKENRPDLFLIDGGRTQLNFALKAVEDAGQDIRVISLAKREEEVFVPGSKESLRLQKDDPALRLLMEIRDEVHRFAISYNRLLRSKSLLK